MMIKRKTKTVQYNSNGSDDDSSLLFGNVTYPNKPNRELLMRSLGPFGPLG